MSNPNNGLKQFDFVIVDRKYVGSIIKLWTPQTNTFEIKYRDNSGRKLCESVKPDRIIRVPNEIEKFYNPYIYKILQPGQPVWVDRNTTLGSDGYLCCIIKIRNGDFEYYKVKFLFRGAFNPQNPSEEVIEDAVHRSRISERTD
jgi:hypothetical protein